MLPLERSSDERLARRATKGDEQALGAIFERYQQELYRFCLGLLGEPQDAQRQIQDPPHAPFVRLVAAAPPGATNSMATL